MSEESQEPEGMDAPPPGEARSKEAKRKRRLRVRKRWILLSIGTAVLSFLAAILVVGVLTLMGRSVELPDWVAQKVENRINAQATDQEVTVEGVSIGLLDDQLRPTVDLSGVRLREKGRLLAALPMLRTKLDTSELIQGRLALETLEISGARLNLTRDENGQFAFAFGTGMDSEDFVGGSVKEVMTAVDEVFAHQSLRELEEVRAEKVTLNLFDRRTDRRVVVRDGSLQLVNGSNFLGLTVAFGISMDGGEPASLVLSADKAKGAVGGRVVAQFANLRARDVAGQVGALNFLEILDAPVDGALTTEFGDEGEVVSLAGALNIGEGFVQPAPQAKPLPLNFAEAKVRYSQATGRLHLEDLNIDAPELRLKGGGHADLLDLEAGIPQTLLMQIRLRDIKLDPEGIFENPVVFAEGQADLRYKPKELKMDVGQLMLRDDGSEILSTGTVSVEEKGWQAAIDAQIGSISQERLLGLWPTTAVEKTRNWLTDNIQSGKIFNAAAALRLTPGEKLMSAVTFDFEGAKVRYLKTLPFVEEGRGYLSIMGNEMSLVLHDGVVTAPKGGKLDVSGSVMQIPDMTKKPAMGEISLRARGPLQAAMSLLDEKPFEFLSKGGFGTDLADGRADVTARLAVPLARKVGVDDVKYDVDAVLTSVSSTKLVEGRSLKSKRMALAAKEGKLSISGAGTLDDIPIDVVWSRDIGPGSGSSSAVVGSVELSPATLAAFNIGLPKGSVRGKGRGNFDLKLVKGQSPDIRLTSDLRGVGLRIDALGWAKAPKTKGDFEVSLTLGKTPTVKGLSISAAGLSAKGTVVLKPGGGLDRAVFTPLTVAGKLNSQVDVVGRGAGRPVLLRVKGGTIDIRKFGVGSGGGTAGGGTPLELALDSLRVTDGIRLDGFRGKFRNDKGLDGTFTGSVNGRTKVNGTVVPTPRGLAVRIASANGGGVLAASGIFNNASGGDMNLVLQPNGKPGQFNGRLTMTNTRVKKAPALADLLSALSVVGLLEQLSGDGILFSDVEATFVLSPGGVAVSESRAVGPSMGITMDGIYSTQSRKVNMRGVVSPLFLVNRPLGFLFAKRGEGLFGFNYTLKGSADGPQVGVNPLSMFTPGIFREIFRQPPPKLQN